MTWQWKATLSIKPLPFVKQSSRDTQDHLIPNDIRLCIICCCLAARPSAARFRKVSS